MSFHNQRYFFALAVILAAASTVLLESQATPGDSLAAIYSHGALQVSIPYTAPHAGSGQLTLEVLDPDDKVLGRTVSEVDVSEGKGAWQQHFNLNKEIPADDLVWQRLRYRFAYRRAKDTIEGTESISEIMRRPVLHIIAQQSYLCGGDAAVRLVVTDTKNEPVEGAGSVRVELTVPNEKPRTLFTGHLNSRGTTEAQFRFPKALVGRFPLRYVVDTALGSTDYTQQVRLEDKVSILLTTEKPIYQPGQTLHVRALALDRADHEAAAGRKLTFEIEDSRGNKVFKKATQTDRFGVASTDFTLADEVNLGTYHLRALMETNEGTPAKTAEVALNVERYVLPKFKVAVEFGGKDNQSTHGYRPGDHVTGTVRANYFFGKPVDRAEVAIKATGMDAGTFEAASLQGKTDDDGAYRFDLRLPNYFAGRPSSQGAARVLIEATVKDAAGHSEMRGDPITVSENPFLITAVPEGGTLVPGLENQVFVLASYPDGTPAVANLRVRADGNAEQSVTTDSGGVAIIRIKPASGRETLDVDARDKSGQHASSSLHLESRNGLDQILLRTERAVYKAGDRMMLRVFSTKDHGSAYVDVVKNGQTVLTRDVEIEHGQAELSLTATPGLAGTVDFNAYQFSADSRVVADHRLVFIQPADELKIEAKADAASYKPGDEARVRFRVTNSKGEGVQAVLGLQVVDEAVFALAEKQPGFAKVFFYLEQEVMKPRYEIHSIGMPEIVEPVPLTKLEQHDRAARALFSATEMVSANQFQTEVGRQISQVKYSEYSSRYQTRFVQQAKDLAAKVSRAYDQKSRGNVDLSRLVAGLSNVDAWGTKLQLDRAPWNSEVYILRSAGPDQRFNDMDDLITYLQVRSERKAGPPTSGTIEIKLDHDRGPFNGRAEISGSVTDMSGAPVGGTTITAREVATSAVRNTRGNASGQFNLAALPEGEYVVQVSASGFQIASKRIKLAARDQALVSVKLQVGELMQTVSVMQMPTAIRVGGNVRAMGGVVMVNGVLGGIVGGLPAAAPMQFQAAMAPPPPMPMARDMVALKSMANTVTTGIASPAAPRVRSYFPEALYINPEIITDANGVASITIPMADSITTWRMAMMASTTHGALGSGTSSLKVFQDFFVDLDLPVTLTQGDRVSIPVAAYNYSGNRGDVALKLQPDDWFSLVNDTSEKSVFVDAGRVGGSQFTIQAKRIGKFKLTLAANLKGGAGRADMVVREIEVIPDGREQTEVFNGRLESSVQHQVSFPAASVPDASKIFVRLYPGPLSQVIEGMDAILRMPYGCFEQTSSSTYPNVLALDYMKRTKKLTPEVHAKAEGFIASGYQRLLTFEVPGGGFSWFGQAPANKILTSYGLMEFSDMSKVHDVDPKLIQRTQQWLAGQQQADGSWKPDTNFINEGATNRFNSDVLRITAYIAWALENTGFQGPAVDRARQYVNQHMDARIDPYTLAVLANFAADYTKDREFTRRTIQLLLDARTEKDDKVWWSAEETAVYARGDSAAIETTGLAVQALLKSGEASGIASKALSYIASKKDAQGTWGTTQATIMALRAVLLSTEKGAADVRGTLQITLNGKPVRSLELTPDNNDLLHQYVFKNIDARGANNVAISFHGKGGLAYQVVGDYFVPWNEKPVKEALSIDVAYDRTHLAQDDIATSTATVKNNLNKSANMVMIDLGIPPGFDLLSEDLQAYQEKTAGQKGGRLEKFNQTATQAILYFDSIPAGGTVTLQYRLRAKYPIRARTLQSRVYEYYDPQVSSLARPVQLEVGPRGR
jgi:uncharacterized protein YfaS (alpha-2-macroglobulin family)